MTGVEGKSYISTTEMSWLLVFRDQSGQVRGISGYGRSVLQLRSSLWKPPGCWAPQKDGTVLRGLYGAQVDLVYWLRRF